MRAIAPLVTALGIAQLVSWGTLFYAIGVLGPAMRSDLGVSELFLFGAFTAGLLVSGTLSPLVGRWVDKRGGRFVLALGSALAATAMALLAMASHSAILVLGWMTAGAAMAACLYDPAFATLSQHAGSRYRKAVTAITIWGGLASTVFWPLSHVLMDAWGWRATFGIYAGLHLFLCLPIHLLFVPRRVRVAHADEAVSEAEVSHPPEGARLHWLTAGFAIASFVSAVVAVHVVNLLVAGGLTQAQAVMLAMLIGPMQVAGRIAEFGFAARVGAAGLGHAALGLMFLAVAALLAVDGFGVAAVLFVTAYGCGNGIFTIVRGTAPAELFGRQGLGAVLGYLARAGLYSRALAPASFSGMLAIGLTRNAALAALAAFALAALASYSLAFRPVRSRD